MSILHFQDMLKSVFELWFHCYGARRLRLGDPVALLPLLNFALLKFSKHVARTIVQSGFEVRGG